MSTKTTNSLADLPVDVTIKKFKEGFNVNEFWVSLPKGERTCPHCGSHDCVIKDSGRNYLVYHTPCKSVSSHIHLHCKRLLCKNCHHTHMELPEWIHPSLHITQSLYLRICLDLTKMLSISEIALQNCVPEKTVSAVLDLIDCNRPKILPEVLCIDEFKGNSGAWDSERKRWNKAKFHTSIVDGSRHIVTDILPEITAAHVSRYFRQYSKTERESVKYFCCDMHNGFVAVSREVFPNAVICIDMFHVIKHLNDTISDIRRRIQRDYESSDTEYRLLKNSMHVLLVKETNIDQKYSSPEKARNRINEILETFPDIAEAYNAVQEFHVINDNGKYAIQRTELTDWLNTYCSSEVPEIRHVANMVRHWRSYIQNTWKYNRSNGVCEGFNNRIKVLKRTCYGLHNFETFRKRILLTCGPVYRSPSPALLFQRNRTEKGGSEL